MARRVIYKVDWDEFVEKLHVTRDGTGMLAAGIGSMLGGGIFALIGLHKQQKGLREAGKILDQSADMANFHYMRTDGNDALCYNDESFEEHWNH